MPTKTKVPNISAARRPQHQANIKPKSEETTLARSQDSQLAARSCGAYRRYTMELDEQLLQQEFELDEQCHQQIMQLQQAAFQQKSQLEHQASTLIMEFKQRQMQEQLQNRLYQQKLKMYQMRARLSRPEEEQT
ncbi:unnamed protein product [Symbiodinium microadriaticum]|nr:unnamed protein product [Symbiodinium microadriaticum]